MKVRSSRNAAHLSLSGIFLIQPLGVLCRGIAVNVPHFFLANMNGNCSGRWRGPYTRAFA
jgi:hypothetical protein